MKILQFFYTQSFSPDSNHARKKQISAQHTLIKGASSSGKKALIKDYLSAFKPEEFLFLDFKDLRFKSECLLSLNEFIQQKPIKILIFYGVDENFDIDFSQFLNQQIIIASEFKSLKIKGFKELWLDFLDFEEFLSFESSNVSLSAQMSAYFQKGRSKKAHLSLFLRANFSALELEILSFIALNLSKEFSINELFKELKKKIKISKDSLYNAVYALENRFMIYFLKHDEKKLKKIFFADFALKNALSIQKDFKALFSNAIFCELLKFEEEIFYNKFFDFYLKKQQKAFIASAFWDKTLLILKAKKILAKALENDIFHLVFITLEDEEILYEKGVKIELIPFDKWALSF